MTELGFWKRSIKIIKGSSDFITTFVFILFLLFMLGYAGSGFLQIINLELQSKNVDFVRYLTEISFTLAGFTFLSSTLLKKKDENFEQIELEILNCSYLFLLAGFFGLVFGYFLLMTK